MITAGVVHYILTIFYFIDDKNRTLSLDIIVAFGVDGDF